MHHIDPKGKAKWYWTLYNIPRDVRSLPANVQGIGTLGNNSINGRLGYAPPHSKGPRDKAYVLTLYALSARWDPGTSHDSLVLGCGRLLRSWGEHLSWN